MKFTWRFYWILKCKVYLAKMNNLPKHHGAGPQRRGAQCSCIGCIGLRPALYAATANKKVACDMLSLLAFNSPQKVMQIWTPNRPSTVICSFATWAREDTRNCLFCKSLKLLPPYRLSSRFTFAPRLLFLVTRATAMFFSRDSAEPQVSASGFFLTVLNSTRRVARNFYGGQATTKSQCLSI